eukprot:TRINITY_DN2492_c0_g1_i2.p1 TRINITY_DN2492_c0_g1~~TRINITY_DN2492_c0_g1_i2.p1  ORF type:complete len:230 (-),score=33.62 TRINITY_DN2492_c0_g1_i2:99-767(-)
MLLPPFWVQLAVTTPLSGVLFGAADVFCQRRFGPNGLVAVMQPPAAPAKDRSPSRPSSPTEIEHIERPLNVHRLVTFTAVGVVWANPAFWGVFYTANHFFIGSGIGPLLAKAGVVGVLGPLAIILPASVLTEIMATRGDVAAARENIIANGEDPELRNASAKFVVVGAVTVLLCCDWAFATVLAMPLQVALVGYGSYMTGETSFRPRLTPPQQVRDEKATDL